MGERPVVRGGLVGDGEPGASVARPLRMLLVCLVLAGVVIVAALPSAVEHRCDCSDDFAVGELRTVATGQTLFREGDKDRDQLLDYATLAQLGATNMIDPLLAAGSKRGYRYTCAPGAEPEYTWAATAHPDPGDEHLRQIGARAYFINHTGEIFYTSQGGVAPLRSDCLPPPGWQRWSP